MYESVLHKITEKYLLLNQNFVNCSEIYLMLNNVKFPLDYHSLNTKIASGYI